MLCYHKKKRLEMLLNPTKETPLNAKRELMLTSS
jgi:hypothetical protein